MQLALLASLPGIAPENARFWTQLDANFACARRFGRGRLSKESDGEPGRLEPPTR